MAPRRSFTSWVGGAGVSWRGMVGSWRGMVGRGIWGGGGGGRGERRGREGAAYPEFGREIHRRVRAEHLFLLVFEVCKVISFAFV